MTFHQANKRLLVVNGLIIFGLFLFSLALFDKLPDQLPMQWRSDGHVNYYLPKMIAAWVAPVVLLLVNIGAILQKKVTILLTLMHIIVAIAVVVYYLSMV